MSSVQGRDLIDFGGLDHFWLHIGVDKSLLSERQALALSLWLLDEAIAALGSLATTRSRRRGRTALCDRGIEHFADVVDCCNSWRSRWSLALEVVLVMMAMETGATRWWIGIRSTCRDGQQRGRTGRMKSPREEDGENGQCRRCEPGRAAAQVRWKNWWRA